MLTRGVGVHKKTGRLKRERFSKNEFLSVPIKGRPCGGAIFILFSPEYPSFFVKTGSAQYLTVKNLQIKPIKSILICQD